MDTKNNAARVPKVQASSEAPPFYECAANMNGHSMRPDGPNGEVQCEWCGEIAAAPAPTGQQGQEPNVCPYCKGSGNADMGDCEMCDDGVIATASAKPVAPAEHIKTARERQQDAVAAGRFAGFLDTFKDEEIAELRAALASQSGAEVPSGLDADEMTRLRRLVYALGMDGEVTSDEQVRGLLFTALGQAAGKIERAAQHSTKEVPSTLYTCKGKGGEYELIGVAHGAGTSRGNTINLYRETATGVMYYRTPTDFHDRMEPLKSQAAATAASKEGE